MREIVERCLSRDPEQRYQRASDAATALRALKDRHAAIAPTVSSPRTKWLLASSAAIIAVIVTLAFVASRSEDAERRTSTGAPASTNQEANEAFELAMNTMRVQGDVARGQQLLERAMALDPHFAEALRYHAINHAVQILNGFTNDTSLLYKAEEELRQAAREDPSLVSLPSAQTMVYLMQGRRELVPIDALDRTLKQSPEHRDTVFWRAILFWLDEDHPAVKQLTTQILEREPLWSPPRMFLADTLRMEGDVGGALRELGKILEQAPGTIPALRLFVHAQIDLGDFAKAHDVLEAQRGSLERNYLWRLTLRRRGECLL